MTSWFNEKFLDDIRLGLFSKHPIAYFSAEFALFQQLPNYSGGLGVLAGDVIREVADLEIPFVGVGLFYKRGYFIQEISKTEGQIEIYPEINPEKAGLKLVLQNGKPLIVEVLLGRGSVFVQVWEYKEKDVSVYLLDTDISQNSPNDRKITENLYGGDSEVRIKQEIILGIGGERALFAIGIHPWVYHMNEGHSAFAILEITHHVMGEIKKDFNTAFKLARDKMVFTNHTLVSAGNDVFEKELVKKYLERYVSHLGLSIDYVLERGKIANEPDRFGMTMFAIRQSCRINAVSQLHEKMAKKLWPGFEMFGITNGVHLSTWITQSIQEFTNFSPKKESFDLENIQNQKLWEIHESLRAQLVSFVKEKTNVSFNSKALTLVWARRFAAYKRPELLFSEIESLKHIAASAHGALQIIIAGKAHPKDKEGKSIIKHIIETIQEKDLSSWIVFLPNYDMESAKYLVSGSDVWLNTPIRGKEASGTSGMKAGANGSLQFSTCDGWFDEICSLGFGWKLGSENTQEHLYNTLEHEILPTFYNRDEYGVPIKWIERMKQTMRNIWMNYSATRMLKDYFKKLYIPALEQFEKDYHKH